MERVHGWNGSMIATLGVMQSEDKRRSLRQRSSIWAYLPGVTACAATKEKISAYWVMTVTYSHTNRAVEAIHIAVLMTFARSREFGVAH